MRARDEVTGVCHGSKGRAPITRTISAAPEALLRTVGKGTAVDGIKRGEASETGRWNFEYHFSSGQIAETTDAPFANHQQPTTRLQPAGLAPSRQRCREIFQHNVGAVLAAGTHNPTPGVASGAAEKQVVNWCPVPVRRKMKREAAVSTVASKV